MVVLIDHHHARFLERNGEGPHLVEVEHIEPYDPHGFERHLEHRKEAHYQGERTPESSEYYERIAQFLKAAPSIALIGDGTGKSSAMVYLLAYLKRKHPEIAGHVLTSTEADLSHLTLREIERIADESVQPAK